MSCDGLHAGFILFRSGVIVLIIYANTRTLSAAKYLATVRLATSSYTATEQSIQSIHNNLRRTQGVTECQVNPG